MEIQYYLSNKTVKNTEYVHSKFKKSEVRNIFSHI